MSNSFSISDLATKQIIQSLHAKGNLVNTVDKSRSRDFLQTKYTPGLTVRIPIEHQPTMTKSRIATVQDVETLESSVTIEQYNNAEDFTSIERRYNMDNEKDVRRYAHKLALRLLREVDVTGFNHMALQTGNNVGTPGVDAAALETWAEARAKITDALAPERECFAAINPMGNVRLTNSLKNVTNPGKEISNQYLRGRMKKAVGLNFYESQSIKRITAGTTTDLAGAVTTTSVSGATSIVLKSLGTGTITAGTKLTVAGSYAVDPETKATLSYLKQFSITADATISGNAATVSISPTIYGTDSVHQNVSGFPTADDVVTITGTGTASDVDAQNVVYDKEAYTLVSVPLPKPKGTVHRIVNYNGIQIRVGYGSYDGTNDTQMLRCDAVWGWGNLRPDHACIVFGD